ncbi:MAG: hypothetical protein EPN55_08960 [Gammaproteobacteria bacterium]|nr:MAG: hypothetical protein EPN55_08960 [Gammaproteobacteria bacterium]
MLTVGFMHIGKISKVAQIMVASVRKAMPAARIVQMTDSDTKPVTGVHDVIRKRYDGKYPMPYRLLHLKDFPDAEAVFLDTDVVVQKDLAPVFENDFDIGLTIRDKPVLDPEGIDITATMPYNTGVMFSRASGRPFWEAAYHYCLTFSDFEKEWWGDQLSIKAVADATPLKLKTFPCDLYNYTPDRPDEDLSGKFVVHYKGLRKEWMLRLAHTDN